MKATVITHVYNEEFLLPVWIRHHLKHFDHGVVIDFASTDNSRKIIQELAPKWTVINSPLPNFDAEKLDKLIQKLELDIEGVKIALTTTEFFLGNPRLLRHDPEFIHSIDLVSKEGDQVKGEEDFHKQFNFGLSEEDSKKIRPNELGRALHIEPVEYETGRHFKGYFGDKLILRVANCLVNDEMITRRLQIQTRIPADDIKNGRGIQHHAGAVLRSEDLITLRQNLSEKAIDLSEELALFFLLDDFQTSDVSNSSGYVQMVRLSQLRYDLEAEIYELKKREASARAWMEGKLEQAEKQKQDIAGKLEQAEEELQAVLFSHSWRLTAPLRTFFRWFEFVRRQIFK